MQPEPLPADIAARFAGFQPFASGDTGTLYLGAHPESGQMVLLKLLASSQTREASERARHHRELRKQLGIAYPHLPRVLEQGESASRTWFVREFVSGQSLLVRLRLHGALRTPAALSVIAQLASTLDALHRQGLVQRDLKPAHVLFRSDKTGAELVQLIDTGIAAALPGGGPELRGTAAYTAPELLEGTPASFRTDLYALGCLACELLTGTQPFARATLEDTLVAQRTEAAPELDAAIPAAVRNLIASMLSKDPRRRPFSAQQVRRSLELFLPDTTPPAPALPRSSPPPPPAPQALGSAVGAHTAKLSAPPLRPGESSAAAAGGEGVGRRAVPGPLTAPPSAAGRESVGRSTAAGSVRAPSLQAPGDRAGRTLPHGSLTAPPPPAAAGASGRPPAVSGPAPSGAVREQPKRSTRPPPPPEALGVRAAGADNTSRASARPAAAGARDTAANGGSVNAASRRPAPDATLELRTEELEPASTAVQLVAPAAAATGGVREPPVARTQELDLDDLLQAPGEHTLASRAPTQRLGSSSALQPSAANARRVPDADDSAPTIAIDLCAPSSAAAPQVDELAQAVVRAAARPEASTGSPPGPAATTGAKRSRTSTPPSAAGSQTAALPTAAEAPPAAPAWARSRKSTQLGMGPVRAPNHAGAVERPPTQTGLGPRGPGGVTIPSNLPAGLAVGSSVADSSSSPTSAAPLGAAPLAADGMDPMAAHSSLEPVRHAEASRQRVEPMDPHAGQERVLRASRRPPLSQRPSILPWAAAALALLALGLRLTCGRGPERASSAAVVVRVPAPEPVASAPQPAAAEPAAPESAAPPPAAAEPGGAPSSVLPPVAAEPRGPVVGAPEPAASAPAAPTAAAEPKPGEPAVRDENRAREGSGGNTASAVPTVTAAQAGKGFLEPGSVGVGGVVPYRARPQADADFKAKARLLYQEGKFRDAADAYQHASQRNPSDAAAHAGAGACWLAVGDADRAIAAYQRAVQLRPDVSGFQAALGRAYLTKGDKARALGAYNRALELDPGNEAARNGAAALKTK